ncbi:hypothetical protein BH23CHL2_BH23CHL2_24960 [soil metagenome]
MTNLRSSPTAGYVKDRLDERSVRAVLEALGVEKFNPYGLENWLVSAPYREDRKPSLSIHRDTGVWNDKATGEAGDFFDLIMKTTGGTLPEAVELVANVAGIGSNGTYESVAVERVSNGRSGRPESRPAGAPIVAEYPYLDEQGSLLYTVHRNAKKTFWPVQPDGTKGYGNRRVLYRLPEILNADDAWNFIVEGEKDVDRLRGLGYEATTSPGGSNGWKSEYGYPAALRGRYVVVLPDNDRPGWKYAKTVAQSLAGIADEVRIVELSGLGPRTEKEGKDVSDWLDAGHTAEELEQLIADTPAWEPADEPEPETVDEPQVAGLVIRSMDEVESRPIDWIWIRWLARRKIHLLGGHAGEGKSLLTTAIAANLSGCDNLPDGATVPQVRTLFLLAEDDVADTVKPRLEAQHARMENIFFIEAVQESDKRRAAFSIARHLPLLEQAIQKYDIDLLIIDPLSAFLQGSERNSEEVRDLLIPLADLAAQTGVAIIGVMHIGKPNGTNRRPLQQLLGATAFGAVARIVWMLAADDEVGGDRHRVLGVVKSNIAYKPPSYAMYIGEDTGMVSWLGESDKSINDLLTESRSRYGGGPSPERREIIDLLDKSDVPLGPKDIAERLDKKVSTTRNLLRKMEEDGNVVRPRTGIYATPGHRFIDFIDSIDSSSDIQDQESTESTESTNLRLGWSVDSLGSLYYSERECECSRRYYVKVDDGADTCAGCGKVAP